MATIEDTKQFENHILEKLNARLTSKGLIRATVDLLAEAIDLLILQVFRKDDYAVRFAVEPLLESSGPLATLPVRLKLIYALGVISRNEYEDVELFLALNNALEDAKREPRFTDDEVLGPLQMLHGIMLPPPPPLSATEEAIDDELVIMRRQRYQQMIRSALVLYVTELLIQLYGKKGI